MKKKTTILTGFLGAGKTTYLNHLIQSNPNIKYAIVENEFGEQNIDNDLIIRTVDDIVELNNGCLCCSLNDNLYDLLSDLHFKKDEFDELIIEATGIADPAGIAEPFITHPAVKKTFELVNTICIVDAENLETWLSETEEARQQISFADIILIGKIDLVEVSYVKQLVSLLKGINPLATIITKNEDGSYPTIHKKTLTNTCNHHNEQKKSCCSHPKEDTQSHSHQPESHNTHAHADIVTCSFVFDEAFDSQQLYQQLMVLLSFQSKDLYRFKGIVYADNPTKKYAIQSVGKRLGIEAIEISNKGELQQSRFVFIGKNLNPAGFKKLLKKCKLKINSNSISRQISF